MPLDTLLCALLLTTQISTATNFMTIEESWRVGLREGFAIASARDSVRTADIQVLAARSEFFPKITPSFSRRENERSWSITGYQALPGLGGALLAERTSRTFEGVQTPAFRLSDTSFMWSQPLLRGLGPNASLYGLRNARRVRQAQERNLILSKQRFMVDIARAYYQTVAQRELLSVARQSATRSEVLRRASEARLDVGLSNKLDVYRAQLSEAQAEQSAVQAEAALQSAIETFHLLLGKPLDDPIEPAPVTIGSTPLDDLPPIETLVQTAFLRRLDLLEVKDQIDDARRTASLSRQNLLPDISLNLRFTEQKSAGSAGPLVVTNRRWESFFSASLPLERAADVAQLQLSNLDVTARERGYQQRRYEVEAEVRSTHRALTALFRSIETQEGAIDIADKQLQLANLRYQRGLASNFDVVDAEGNLIAARGALAQLVSAYRIARLDLERVIGRLDVDIGLDQ
ncbi:MAG: TolC family protein [Vicinamibacteria bacterium]